MMRTNQSAGSRGERLVPLFRTKPLRAALFAVGGLLLAWIIVTRSFVAYLAATLPQAALLLSPVDATALVAFADREFNAGHGGKTDRERESGAGVKAGKALRPVVARALVAAPLNARALRLMGQFAEAEQSNGEAESFMRAATRLSLNEAIAVEWMMRREFEKRDFAAATHYADALLRSRPQFMRFAAPVLARMAEDPDGRGAVSRLLSANPPWRANFFQALGTTISDAHTPLILLLSLKDSAAPPTISERHTYLAFLISRQLYEFAYHAWLQFLSPDVLASTSFLFNGSFESAPSGAPFDWTIGRGSGAIAEITPRPGANGKSALLIEFGQRRVVLPRVAQIIVLPPGNYRFRGVFRGDAIGLRGVHWSVSCMNRNAAIGESKMILGSFLDWRNFEFDLVVPEKKCVAQTVQLRLSGQTASEQPVSGAIWFDDLSITRRPDAEN